MDIVIYTLYLFSKTFEGIYIRGLTAPQFAGRRIFSFIVGRSSFIEFWA